MVGWIEERGLLLRFIERVGPFPQSIQFIAVQGAFALVESRGEAFGGFQGKALT